MAYYVDLSKITLQNYKLKLQKAYLPPSRIMLKDRVDERFAYFESLGIKNIQELVKWLKKNSKTNPLQHIECFSGDYLTILLRELNSIQPKPNKISDFQGISQDVVSCLEAIGIKDTAKLYDRVKTIQHRKELVETTGIGDSQILELTKLTDLSRIKWVGASFARMLYNLGMDTLEKVANANYQDLHSRVNSMNKEMSFYKAQIGLNDIKICIQAASEIPLDIEY